MVTFSSRLIALVLLLVPCAFGQGSVTFSSPGWEHTRRAEQKQTSGPSTPTREMIPENKAFQRAARENTTKGAVVDPNELTIDGRSAALEKINQEARAPKADSRDGYTYFANFKNGTDRTIDILFWEYRFTELATPTNIVRRQFLCAASMKPGDEKRLWAFSSLGPSEVLSAESLAKRTEKIFDEKIIINRIEFADGGVLTRKDWNYKDVEKAVKRATSTPWTTEVCRPL